MKELRDEHPELFIEILIREINDIGFRKLYMELYDLVNPNYVFIITRRF